MVAIVIDHLGRSGRRSLIVSGERLNVAPVGKELSLEIMLCGVWKEFLILSDPGSHLLLCVRCV
jgi:hypothetical protein